MSASSINLFTPVMATPSISLFPTFGPPGVEVFFTGSGYSTLDRSCTVSSYGSGGSGSSGFISSSACAVALAAGATSLSLSGGFIVATNAGQGELVVRVTGVTAGDYAEGILLWP